MKTYDDDDFTVVNVTTQAQWDDVSRTLKYLWNEEGTEWSVYGENSCICLNAVAYGELSYFQDEGDLILTFDEWKQSLVTTEP